MKTKTIKIPIEDLKKWSTFDCDEMDAFDLYDYKLFNLIKLLDGEF